MTPDCRGAHRPEGGALGLPGHVRAGVPKSPGIPRTWWNADSWPCPRDQSTVSGAGRVCQPPTSVCAALSLGLQRAAPSRMGRT